MDFNVPHLFIHSFIVLSLIVHSITCETRAALVHRTSSTVEAVAHSKFVWIFNANYDGQSFIISLYISDISYG
jgi:hypothetical protein